MILIKQLNAVWWRANLQHIYCIRKSIRLNKIEYRNGHPRFRVWPETWFFHCNTCSNLYL